MQSKAGSEIRQYTDCQQYKSSTAKIHMQRTFLHLRVENQHLLICFFIVVRVYLNVVGAERGFQCANKQEQTKDCRRDKRYTEVSWTFVFSFSHFNNTYRIKGGLHWGKGILCRSGKTSWVSWDQDYDIWSHRHSTIETSQDNIANIAVWQNFKLYILHFISFLVTLKVGKTVKFPKTTSLNYLLPDHTHLDYSMWSPCDN